jgi:autotransporter family porin
VVSGAVDALAGAIHIEAHSIGVYWTHTAASQWFTEAVLMNTSLSGSTVSRRGIDAEVSGRMLTASLEGGFALVDGGDWRLEPQAQAIWQRLDLDDASDSLSSIRAEQADVLQFRFGARVTGTFSLGGLTVEPHLTANIWYAPDKTSDVTFGATTISSSAGGVMGEIAGGGSVILSSGLRLFGTGSFMTALEGSHANGHSGSIGLNLVW